MAEGTQQTALVVIEPLAATYAERAQQMFFLGLALAESGDVGVLQQVFFISEAWLSVSEQGKTLEQPPSEDPKRKKVMIVAHHTLRPPNAEIAIFEMKRDEQGTLTGLKPLHSGEEVGDAAANSLLVDSLILGFLGGDWLPDD